MSELSYYWFALYTFKKYFQVERFIICNMLLFDYNKVTQIYIQCKMEELVVLIQQRIHAFQFILEKQFSPSSARQAKQQEKNRCQKEGFIISMIKSNKISNLSLRRSFYNGSYQVMKKMKPQFQFRLSQSLQTNFLNDFVVLYSQFFKLFQEQFSFKTKVQNFLRPTNHNLITDLIKYLVDFTRDYFLQVLFWKNKTYLTNYKTNQESSLKNQAAPNKVQQLQYTETDSLGQKLKHKKILQNGKIPINEAINNISPRKKSDSITQEKKNQIPKIYDVLGISNLNSLFCINKDSASNLQAMKIRINQIYRDQKSRNCQIKQIYQQYFQGYNQKHCITKQRQLPFYEMYQRTKLNRLIEPFKLLLTIQKNGFSYINILFDPRNKFAQKTYHSNYSTSSPDKFKISQKTQTNILSPLKINKRNLEQYKIDPILISMKVLRASDNFLPPLIKNNICQHSSSKYQGQENQKNRLVFSLKLKKTLYDNQNLNIAQKQTLKQNNQVKNMQLVSSYNHRSNRLIKLKDSRAKPFQYQIAENITRESEKKLPKRQPTQPELNQSLNKKQINPKKRYLQFSQQKKLFKSQKAKGNREQQKILEWLQKIKNLKQIERRKILGMNY